VDRILPLRGPSRNEFGYSIRVKDGTLVSYLPYFGVSRSMNYNEGNPLNFEGPVESYAVSRNRKGAYVVEFLARNPANHEQVLYQLSVWEDGETSMTVHCPDRDRMAYTGRMTVPAPDSDLKNDK